MHTFDTNLRFTGSNSPLTQLYTCGAGATVLVLGIVVGGSTERAGGAPTYNDVELTQADETRKYTSSPETSCELWYLLAPPTGTAHTLSVPNTGAKSLYVQASSYKAASGYTSVLDVAGGETGLSIFPDVVITTTANGDVIVGVMGNGFGGLPGTFGIILNRTDDGTYSDNNQYKLQTTAGAYTMSWSTTPHNEDYCICVAAFKEAVAATIVTPTVLTLAMSLKAPVVVATGNQTLALTALAVVSSLKATSIQIAGNQTVIISALSITSSLKAPTVSAQINTTVTLTALSLASSVKSPSILIGDDLTVIMPVQSLALVLNDPTPVEIINITVSVTELSIFTSLKVPSCRMAKIVDWSAARRQRMTLNADTSIDFTAPNETGFLKLIINNRGAYAVSWPDNVVINSAISSNKKNVVLFDYAADGNYYGVIE